jgi:hypothetical protein
VAKQLSQPRARRAPQKLRNKNSVTRWQSATFLMEWGRDRCQCDALQGQKCPNIQAPRKPGRSCWPALQTVSGAAVVHDYVGWVLTADINDEFNPLNTNLVVAADAAIILEAGRLALHLKDGRIMTKSVLTGIAVCAALAAFSGNANAYTTSTHTSRTLRSLSSLTPRGGRLHDCVHVAFPQCSPHGPDQPNH